MAKSKAETNPIPPMIKKSLKKEQQDEFISQLDNYFNSINNSVVFKREKSRLVYLRFVAPIGNKDDGFGSVNGGDVEAWYSSAFLQ